MITSSVVVRVVVVALVCLVGGVDAMEKKEEKPYFMPYYKREVVKRRIQGAAADKIRQQYNVGPEGVKGTMPRKDRARYDLCGQHHPAVLLADIIDSSAIAFSIKKCNEDDLTVKCRILVPTNITPDKKHPAVAVDCSNEYDHCYGYCRYSYNPNEY